MKHLFLAGALLLFSCKNNSKAPAPASGQKAASTEIPKDFTEFYQQFHNDSVFQMEHIVFPLQGLPDHADSLTLAADTFHWQQNKWLMQKPVDFQMSDYQREIIPINEQMVIERINHKSGDMGTVRRFAMVAGEWHLIYYAGMNQLANQ